MKTNLWSKINFEEKWLSRLRVKKERENFSVICPGWTETSHRLAHNIGVVLARRRHTMRH